MNKFVVCLVSIFQAKEELSGIRVKVWDYSEERKGCYGVPQELCRQFALSL